MLEKRYLLIYVRRLQCTESGITNGSKSVPVVLQMNEAGKWRVKRHLRSNSLRSNERKSFYP